MDPEVLKIASGLGVWVTASFIVGLVVVQSIMYIKLAYKTADKLKMKKETCQKAFKAGVVTAIGPSIAIFIVMVGMMAVIGAPMSWMRLAVIGAAPTELTAARLGAEAAGREFGGADYDLYALASSWWTMAINGVGWLLMVGIFAPKLEFLREKASGNDIKWLAWLTGAATLGAFGFLNSANVVRGGPLLVAVLIGAGTMAMLGIVIPKYPKLGLLKEYALSIALVLGILIAAASQYFWR